MAPHSSTLAWKIPWTEEPGRLQSVGSLRVRHDWVISLSLFTFMHWRRKWQPAPVFLPGESQGQGARWAAVYGVAQSRTRVKRLSSSSRAIPPWRLPCEKAFTAISFPWEEAGLLGLSPSFVVSFGRLVSFRKLCPFDVSCIHWQKVVCDVFLPSFWKSAGFLVLSSRLFVVLLIAVCVFCYSWFVWPVYRLY